MSDMANGARSVPQIFVDNIHIGDCDKIHKFDQEKKLDKLLGLE
jgi:glutaredoxin 3